MIISKQLNGGSSAPTLKLEVTPQDYNVEENTTPVKYVFTIERPSQINSNASKTYSISIDDETITGSTIVGGIGTKTIKSGTVKVKHNVDGTKIINISFSINIAITWSDVYNGIVSSSGTMSLPTIPRATEPSVKSSATLNDTVTISTPRKSASFKHKLYAIINGNKSLISDNVDTSYSWKIPLKLANYITETDKAICRISCETYNGDTLIGSKNVSVTLKVPSNIIPPITSINVTEASQISLEGYVEGKSKLNVVINASGVYASVIKTVTSTLNGVIYKELSFITETLDFNTNKNLEVTVTDSRGRTNTASVSITPMAYKAPKILKFNVNRCLQDGTLNDSGTYLKIDYSYEISSLNNQNTKQVEFYYETSNSFATFKTLTSDYASSGSFVTEDTFSLDISYLLRMKVIDKFTDVKAFVNVDTDSVTFDIHSSGQGMALGKVSEEQDLFDVNWLAKFRKRVEFYRDTPWINLALDTAWTYYNNDVSNTPKYRVKGDVVEIRGQISPTTAHVTSNTRETIATLPSGVRPSSDIYVICQGSGKATWLFSVQKTGEITLSRYGVSSNDTVPLNAWLPFQVTYILD